jgi:DNA repair exonuclease SbcCD ATPase subunit
MYQEIEEAEKEKRETEEDLKSGVEALALRQEVEEAKKMRLEDLKENLRWKRQELLRTREQLVKRLKEAKQQLECYKSPTPTPTPMPTLVEKCSEEEGSDDWVGIDDDHFATSEGSGWVVCSYGPRAM